MAGFFTPTGPVSVTPQVRVLALRQIRRHALTEAEYAEWLDMLDLGGGDDDA